MPEPRISVVVPFYNNEDLLGECLRSIAAQTHASLEVIMVDDGSVDGSAGVAQSFADSDPRFRLVRVENGGPGHARNRGIEHATGEFLAFVDADDMLPSHAYERMLHALASSGSDFLSGGVERVGPAGITLSALHAKAIKGRHIGTHISRNAELFYDVSVWNKLFRRSFWDASGITYPEGMLWEDLQAMTRAHVLAKAVDVIPEPIYYWRERGKGALSITQSRTDIANFRDRITALLAIDSFLRNRGTARLLRQHQRKALVNDLWLYVRDLSRTSDEYRAEFVELGGRYLDQVDKRVLASLPAAHKLAYHLISRRAVAELAQFNAWRSEQPIRTVPVVRRLGRLRADLPFRGDKRLQVPDWVYRPHWRELDPYVRVEGIDWERDRLVITGCAYVPSIDITKRRHTSKIVILRPRSRLRPPIVLVARSVWHPEATLWSGQDRYAYDWAGFRCEISPGLLRVAGRWLTGDWDCLILVRARGVWRPARLHTPLRGPAERPEYREVAPGIRFGARWDRRQLHIEVARTPAVLRSCAVAGRDLAFEVNADLPGVASAELQLVWPKGVTTRRFPAEVARMGGGADGRMGGGRSGGAGGRGDCMVRIRGTVPIAAVAAGAAGGDERGAAGGGATATGDDTSEWDLYVKAGGQERVRVAFPGRVAELRHPMGSREIVVERTSGGDVVLAGRRVKPVVQEHSWSEDGRLTLRGRYPVATPGTLEMVLSRRSSTAQHAAPLSRRGDSFEVTLDVAGMPTFGRRLPLRDGVWNITVRGQDAGGENPVVPAYDHARLAEVSGRKVTCGPKVYRFTTSGHDEPVITVGPVLRLTEQGRIQRRALRSVYYPVQLRLPIRDSIFFISWKGKQCADNPLAIAQELRRRGDTREHFWAVSDWAVPVPDGGRGVLTGTEEYFEAKARSRYVIANDDMHQTFVKRDGQVYVQTWHGTPLKRIGFDVAQPKFISGTRYLDHLAEDVAKWDLLLSPNPFSTQIMRRAFRFDGEICESGYPRNDLLHSGDAGAATAAVRRRLGLPEGKRVILYAPTWRDNQYYASGRYRFDFRLDLERAWRQLGDDYVFLIRGHHHMADDVTAGTRKSFAVNVTGYPDIAELYLVSDALVTDYSSAMFDFAPTGRPIMFFTYDLESYRDEVRGFYFDLAAEAPGPLLATSDEVVAAVADLDSAARGYAAARAAFIEKYCPLDDGKAAARACDRIFGG